MAIGDAIRKYQERKFAEAEDVFRVESEVSVPASSQPVVAIPPPEEPSTMAAVLAKMAAILEQVTSAKTDTAKDAAYKQIELIQQLITKTHPENVDHPGISVYSYPEGDVAHPKPPLKCKIFWVGYELQAETLRPDEVELLNRLTPGEYRVTKADGIGIPFRVQAKASDKLDVNGKPAFEELSIWFPCKGDARQNHLSLVSYLQQALGERIPTVQEMMIELTRLKRELDAARAGVIGVV